MERVKFKAELERIEMKEDCPFHPEISRNTKLLMDSQMPNQEDDFSDRLYQDAFERLRRQRQVTLEKNEQVNICSFRPVINDANMHFTKNDEVPIHERYMEEILKRKQNLQHLAEKVNDERDLTFHPKIGATSRMVSEKIYGGEDVVSRQVNEVGERAERKQELIRDRNRQLADECTFEPELNKDKNYDLLRGKDGEEEDFQKRQENFKVKKQQDLAMIKNEVRCEFKPQINQISKYLVEGDPSKENEDLTEKVKRQAINDLERREQLKQQLLQEEIEKYTFQPKINELSSILAKPKTFNEQADYKEVERKRTEKMKQRDIEEEKICTFKPTKFSKNQKYDKKVQSHYSKNNYHRKLKEGQEKKKLQVKILL